MRGIRLCWIALTIAVAMASAAQAQDVCLFQVDLSPYGGTASGWDYFTTTAYTADQTISLTDQSGQNVTGVTAHIGEGWCYNSFTDGTANPSPVDGVTVPQNVYKDRYRCSNWGNRNPWLHKIENLPAADYRVTLFTGANGTAVNWKAEVWVDSGDGSGETTTTNIEFGAGGSDDVTVTIDATNDVLWIRDYGYDSDPVNHNFRQAASGYIIRGFNSNEAPVADAGEDQLANDNDGTGAETVVLYGAASTDADGTIVSWVWKEGQTQIATGETAEVSLAVGTHTITLTVTDDEDATDDDTVTVEVNGRPAADAGEDDEVTDADDTGSETVTLDGSASSDADGTIVSWVWKEGETQIATGETAEVSLSAGTHTITLTVMDNEEATDDDTVAVTIIVPAYYVDYESGDDSNNGTSSSEPWQHCPGDANATGAAASTGLKAGQVVFFRTGTTYVMSASGIALSSGAEDAPVVYDGWTWGGGDRCILTGQNAVSSNYALGFKDSGSARSYIVITGFNFRDIGGYAEDDPIWETTDPVTSPPGGCAISLTGGGAHVIVEDCLFAEVGQWRNIIPMSDINSVTGSGVSLKNNTDVTVSNCDFTRMRTGVAIKATTAISWITVQDCTFHNYMNWLIDVATQAAGASFSNITIDRCTLYNYKEFDRPNWLGYGEKPHQDGIFFRTSGMPSTWENIAVSNCRFYSDMVSNGGTTSIYASAGPSVDVYNCVFTNDFHNNGAVYVDYNKPAGMTQTVRLWNNTFVGGPRTLLLRGNPDTVEIINNVFYRTNTSDVVQIELASLAGLTMDYNVFYGGDPAKAVFYGGYRTLASWQSVSGQDSHSVFADPQLASTSGAASTWDLHPTANSPMVGAGADLSEHFTTDKDGTERSTPWDIGAHVLP